MGAHRRRRRIRRWTGTVLAISWLCVAPAACAQDEPDALKVWLDGSPGDRANTLVESFEPLEDVAVEFSAHEETAAFWTETLGSTVTGMPSDKIVEWAGSDTLWVLASGAVERKASDVWSCLDGRDVVWPELERGDEADTVFICNAEQLTAAAGDLSSQAGGGRGVSQPLLLGLLVAIAAAGGAGAYVVSRRRAAMAGASSGDGGDGDGLLPPPPPPPPEPEPEPEPEQSELPHVSPAGPAPRARRAASVGLWPTDHVGGDAVGGTKVRWISPEPVDERARVWIHDEQLAFGFCSEKIAGSGEDADPVLLTSSARLGQQLLGVLDGMGGAGSGRVPCDDGVVRSQAYLASRLVRAVLSDSALRLVDGHQLDVDSLQSDIVTMLQDMRDRWQLEQRSSLKGGLRRTLPTTMAVATVDNPPGQDAVVTALWAGDSRAYLLTPEGGLQQLTADHTRERDILAQLTDDPPISNVVSASQSFTIDRHAVPVAEPFAVICATDGVFGYVQTPGEVEFHVLDTLHRAKDIRDWANLLVRRVLGYTADDTSFVLSAIGFRDVGQLKKRFRDRTRLIHATQVAPFESMGAADHETVRSVRQAAWEEYRDLYTSLMPAPAPRTGGR